MMLGAIGPEAGQEPPSLADHLLNVAVLAVRIGYELLGEKDRLVGLALAALVHDVGMCLLPVDLRSKPGPLGPDELELLRQHPILTATLAESWGGPLAPLVGILLQEHEREDGSGYPHDLVGKQISLEAKLLGLGDTYEAMTHNRPYRAGRHPHDVMRDLLSTAHHLFERRLLGALTRQISLYPLGSVVELNSREQGIVVGVNPSTPMRPYLLIISRRDVRSQVVPRLVNLIEEPILHIQRCVRPSER
ncbi:MAG: HD domain-containing protein [Candidatus Brocadiales bacterium]|nr:HD domain-containing protein [Candidatus Bathyanammoxibius sp.]